jgi:hypothetical protein
MTSLVRSRAEFNCKRKHTIRRAKRTSGIILGVGRWELGIALCRLLVALCVTAACGKKGPPLTPLVPIPAAVELIEASRLGSDVYVSLTIPAMNIDEYIPADIARVEVYGYTGRSAPPRARWVELSSLIATVPVAPPVAAEEEADRTHAVAGLPDAPTQGTRITVRDTLTPEELVQGKEPPLRDPGSGVRDPHDKGRMPPNAESSTPDLRSRIPDPVVLKRFYAAVPFNGRGRPGPPGGVAEFPLLPTPDPPPSLVARYSERAIVLAWEPSGGLIGFLLERALPDEPPPFDEEESAQPIASAEAPAALLYNVYREFPSDPLAPPGPTAAIWREEPPTAITAIPIPALTFTDNVEFGRTRCYTVRAVRGVGPSARSGDASPPACFTPTDTFPPAPPQSVTTVASERVISLVWEPNTELDLGGYVVLRGEAPGDTLRPLTSAPILNAGYRDETVTPGVRYVYAVVAVDNRFPMPNISLESNRVEETAR